MIWPIIALIGGMGLFAAASTRKKTSKPSGFTPMSIPPPPPHILSALRSASAKYGVPLNILVGVAHTESRYNPRAVSRVGAKGLMQLMPVVIRAYGIKNPFDPLQNAMGGARFLAKYYKVYGDWPRVLAAYNWGPGYAKANPEMHQWPPQTQAYVTNVLQKAAA